MNAVEEIITYFCSCTKNTDRLLHVSHSTEQITVCTSKSRQEHTRKICDTVLRALLYARVCARPPERVFFFGCDYNSNLTRNVMSVPSVYTQLYVFSTCIMYVFC